MKVLSNKNLLQQGMLIEGKWIDADEIMRVSDITAPSHIAGSKMIIKYEPAALFGGVKESGIGREGSNMGLMEYMEAKYILA